MPRRLAPSQDEETPQVSKKYRYYDPDCTSIRTSVVPVVTAAIDIHDGSLNLLNGRNLLKTIETDVIIASFTNS